MENLLQFPHYVREKAFELRRSSSNRKLSYRDSTSAPSKESFKLLLNATKTVHSTLTKSVDQLFVLDRV